MKTLQEQYNLINEGKGHKEVFLKSAKGLFPDLILNHFGYGVTTQILKQKGIISENRIGGLVSRPAIDPFNKFNQFLSEEAKAVEKAPTKEVTDMETKGYDYKNMKDIDNLYGEAFLEGYYTEMKDPKNKDKTVDELKAIVAKNLTKDKLYYVKDGEFGVKGVGYTTEAPGLGEGKPATGKWKASGYGNLKESIKSIAQDINQE
jgi:hypothetical protein